MTVSALSAAKTLCELRDWSVSNLELQKILYLANLYHLGQKGESLVREDFEAWDYGPVVPVLYHRAKAFGSDPVRNVFHEIPSVPMDAPEYGSLAMAAEGTKTLKPGKLVAITHWDGGAWHELYRPGVRGVCIPTNLILKEYNARVKQH